MSRDDTAAVADHLRILTPGLTPEEIAAVTAVVTVAAIAMTAAASVAATVITAVAAGIATTVVAVATSARAVQTASASHVGKTFPNAS